MTQELTDCLYQPPLRKPLIVRYISRDTKTSNTSFAKQSAPSKYLEHYSNYVFNLPGHSSTYPPLLYHKFKMSSLIALLMVLLPVGMYFYPLVSFLHNQSASLYTLYHSLLYTTPHYLPLSTLYPSPLPSLYLSLLPLHFLSPSPPSPPFHHSS